MIHVPAWLLWSLAFLVGLPLVALAIVGAVALYDAYDGLDCVPRRRKVKP